MAARILVCAVIVPFMLGVGRVCAQAPPIPPQEPAADAEQAPAPVNPGAAAVPAAPGQAAAQGAAAQGQANPQVLEEGPIHEAFAEPIALDAKPRVTVNREPPEPVNEVPPDVRPEGENIQWIPGYWMWSDVQNDFVWVSGVWRDFPPGRRWVPGHWTKVAAGYEWVSGFWAGEQVQEMQLLPNPPATLEVGPSSPAPGDNYFWVPGSWVWQNGAYGWRAGYWYLGQSNWVWVPDHYCYTPGGSYFVSGYWDYPLVRRGLLFAPVYWPNRYYGAGVFAYRPYSFINTALLLTSLFVHDRHHHYYFGHGHHWRGNNFHPWWEHGHHHRHHGYDPLWAYHRWHDGHNKKDWEDNWRKDFDRRRDDFDRAGPGGGRGDRPGDRPGGEQLAGHNRDLVRRLDDVTREGSPNVHLRRMDAADVARTKQQISDWKELREARKNFETRVATAGEGGRLEIGGVQGGGRGRVQVGDRTVGPGGQVQIGANGRGGAVVNPGGAGDATAQAGVSGDARVRGRAQGQLGSPLDQRRATFKLPPADQTTAGTGTPSSDAAARVQGRGSWSNRFQNRSGGNVVVPGAGQTTSPQIDQSNMGRARVWQGGQAGAQQAGAQTGGGVQIDQASPGGRNWSYRGGGRSSQFRSQFPQGGSPQIQQGGTPQLQQGGRPQFQQGGNSQFQPGGQPTLRGSQIQVPSGRTQIYQGGQPSYRGSFTPGGGQQFNRGSLNPGGGQPSYRGSFNAGGQSSFQRSYNPGGQSSYRGNWSGGGGRQEFNRGNYSGGGRGQSFRSSGGGGESSFRSGGGGGGQSFRGGGGGGGRGGGGRGGGRGDDD